MRATTSTSMAEPDAIPFVRPALSVGQYVNRIVATRQQAYSELRDLVEAGRFKVAAEALVLYPFDDVAQSAFFLPFAMLRVDDERAISVSLL